MPVVPHISLAPDRKRAAVSCRKLLISMANSDAKQYASGKTFLPIFPTDDAALQAALTVVNNRLMQVTVLS